MSLQKDNTPMDYVHAVALAREGDEEGFKFLYEKTSKEKYYIAIKYMKNEESAEDVLQDAYIRAFSKLDTLKDANAFPSWFGQIVANTAKNALVKKNPILFSEMNNDSVTDENWEYQFEDGKTEYRPEEAYTQKETQELVHELLDSLSDEQRVCMLMFYIEEQSIKDIANALDCSENTVKSRLNYGRKNLKIKAESLQKKGYKLYSIAPLPLLLYLLRAEEAYLSADGTLAAVGERMAEQIFHFSATADDTGVSGGAKEVVENGAKVAKSGFLHTVAGKMTVAVVGLCVAGGAVFYGVSQMDSKEQKPEIEVVSEQEDTVPEESYPLQDESETEQEESETEQDASVADAWRTAYTEVIQNAPNQTYRSGDLVVAQPYINYLLLDMEGDSIPELIVTATSGEDGGEGTLSFRNSVVFIYSYSEDAGAQLKEEYVYYMPGFLKDENNNLIISSIDAFNGQATYYSVRMENGSLYEEQIYNEQFPTFEYESTFNQEHGFVGLEYSEVDDLTLVLENDKVTKADEAVKTASGSESDAEKKAYAGTYKNSVEESAEITINEDGQLKVTHQNSEYNIDINNKQDDGSVIAYRIRNDFGDTTLCVYIYSVGIELSAYDHDTDTLKITDKNKIRLFFTYQDVPDIKSNVYYKMD